MKKYYLYIIISLIIIIALVLINHFLQSPNDTQIKDKLISEGIVTSEYDDLLIKQEDEKKYSFSTANYTYMLEVEENDNGIISSLNATYDYKNNTLVYSYRVNNSDTVNVLFKGNYNNQQFVCDKEFSNGKLSDSEQNTICSIAESNIKIFYAKSKTLFGNYKLIDYMKQK